MIADDHVQYRVEREDDRFRVTDVNGFVMLESCHEQTASHQAELLNRAFRAGYKQGYREGKASAGS